jgi:ABC-type Fe3+-hydroxamate transport system substrate-binding protein
MITTDQIGNTINLLSSPKRIVSLVPSQTELLNDLALNNEVIGITKFCVHPTTWFKTKTRVGGTKTVNIQKVISLKPDLVIANKEENVKEQIESLQNVAPVYVSNISTLSEAMQMMQDIGEIAGRDQKAKEIVAQIQHDFAELKTVRDEVLFINDSMSTFSSPPVQYNQLRAAYLIWKDPYMVAGGDTFINDMMNRCGFKNVFDNLARYPAITTDQLTTTNCQLLLLSSEPYPFKQKHIEELQLQLPDTGIILVDGEMFSWYGSRLLQAPAYFRKLIAQVQA